MDDVKTPLEEALDYAEEREFGLVEIFPNDISDDRHSVIRVNAGGRCEMLVTVGWGTAGLNADVAFYVEDQPVGGDVFALGDTVTVIGPPYDD